MKLSDWLAKKNMSASEFADAIGCDRATVWRWIDPKDPKMPRKKWRGEIKKATGGAVLPSDFMNDEEADDDAGSNDDTEPELKACAI